MKVKVEKLEGSKVKVEVVLTKEEFNEQYEKAFEKVLKDVEVKGFRKGKVPREMYLKRFGEYRTGAFIGRGASGSLSGRPVPNPPRSRLTEIPPEE